MWRDLFKKKKKPKAGSAVSLWPSCLSFCITKVPHWGPIPLTAGSPKRQAPTRGAGCSQLTPVRPPKNEESLKKCVQDYIGRIEAEGQRYQALKAHAEEKLQQ